MCSTDKICRQDKKAKSNLIKGASREAFETEEMQKCTMMIFSVGAYHEIIIPNVADWRIGSKFLNVDVENVIPGYDDNNKHMQTIIKFLFNKNMITVTCFNSTQKIKVEGRGYLEFVRTFLNPLIRSKLGEAALERIEKYNRDVIAALSGKRKVISRPMRSVKYKAMAKLPCSKCNSTFANNATLTKHKRSMHTRGGANDSTISGCNMPLVDDISLLEISYKEPTLALTLEECGMEWQTQKNEEKSPVVEPTFKCSSYSYSSLIETELQLHTSNTHVEIKKTVIDVVTKKTDVETSEVYTPSRY